jgi:hypothetical protein
VTLAPGIAAPLGSFAVPRIVPLTAWAAHGLTIASSNGTAIEPRIRMLAIEPQAVH